MILQGLLRSLKVVSVVDRTLHVVMCAVSYLNIARCDATYHVITIYRQNWAGLWSADSPRDACDPHAAVPRSADWL